MKIISNFKDFYDSVDNNTDNVYTRKQFVSGTGANAIEFDNLPPTSLWVIGSTSYKLFFLYFCDEVYPYIYNINNRKTYFSHDNIPHEFFKDCHIDTYTWDNVWGLTNKWHYHLKGEDKVRARRSKLEDLFNNFKGKTWDFNTKIGYPILFERPKDFVTEKVIDGNLSSIGFDKVITPEETYCKLHNWLNKHQNQLNYDQ